MFYPSSKTEYPTHDDEVATISRLHKNIGLFFKTALQKRPIFFKSLLIIAHEKTDTCMLTVLTEL